MNMAGQQPGAPDQTPRYVVGIGASAGGLEALQGLLDALAPDTGFPFVVVQHLSPNYKSLLVEILGKHTEMPVIQAEDGAAVLPNHVYVIRPGKNLRLEKGRLRLCPQRETGLNLPIDLFFASLAEDVGARAIAIVLSGTGSDGTNGIKEIKEQGGMVIAQDVESSKFDGMPASAIRTGLVDARLSPADIARELGLIARTAPPPAPPDVLLQADADALRDVLVILKKVCNINFTNYKRGEVSRRVQRRMVLTHKASLAEYVECLAASADEARALAREVLIGVTGFFRDPECFQALADKTIRDILLRSDPSAPIRVWVPGCSTGEEAYSIAILFQEGMEALRITRAVKIFATDLDAEAVAIAGQGVYSENIAETVSSARLGRFFSHKENTYTVSRGLRNMIVFSRHNVFQDPPLGRLDLISCRNLLTYFQPVLQNDLFALFHLALKDGGYLFLGKSEGIGAFADAFPLADASARIYGHRSGAKMSEYRAVPYLQTSFPDSGAYDQRGEDAPTRQSGVSKKTDAGDGIDTSLLERFMPTCVVVNRKNEITHIYGESGNYVRMPAGKFTVDAFDIITDSLKAPASVALKEARITKRMVQYKGIAFRGEREDAVVTLAALPVSKAGAGNDELYALVFLEKSARGEVPDAAAGGIDRLAAQRIADLEQELTETRGALEEGARKQESAGEELQSANEELQTANEELQSSNEELQSVNEELYTVNSEYQHRVTELADLNDDITNILASKMIGIIFVDGKMNIRRFTDYAGSEFSVMKQDIGRPLQTIAYHFPSADIVSICDNVLKTLASDEREVVTGKGKAFFIRVAPYRSAEDRILGCVITFIEITEQRAGREKLLETRRLLASARKLRDPVSALAALAREVVRRSGDPETHQRDTDRLNELENEIDSLIADLKDVPEADA